MCYLLSTKDSTAKICQVLLDRVLEQQRTNGVNVDSTKAQIVACERTDPLQSDVQQRNDTKICMAVQMLGYLVVLPDYPICTNSQVVKASVGPVLNPVSTQIR